jgi:hypothetical protein
MLMELLGHRGTSQCYRQHGQPLGLRHQDTVNATVLQSVTVMQQTNQTILTLARPIGGAEGTDRDAGAVGGLGEAVQYELLNRSTTSLRTSAISSAVQPLCLNHSSFLSGLIT